MNRISPKRKPVETPKTLINDDGSSVFGTFSEPFKQFNLLEFKSNSKIRKAVNSLRLTEWEAVEVISSKGAFLTAIYKFGILDINLTVFFEKATSKLYVWNHMSILQNRSHLAKNLFDGRTSIYQIKNAKTVITNNYEDKKAICQGFSKNKKQGTIEFDFCLKRMSKPSVVSIPVKNKYPVYTEKDLLDFTGSIKINGIEMVDITTAKAVIDDHRGYYPRKSGYDWLTTFGKKNIAGFDELHGLNLTDFRLNPKQFDFNENGYWNKDDFHPLPIARFDKNKNITIIKDSYGDIDLTYETVAIHKVTFNVILFRIDYRLSFGKLNGYINSSGDQKIEYHDDLSISEYRYTII